MWFFYVFIYDSSCFLKINFKNGTKTAIVKATTGGTISVHHQKKSKKYRHKLIAKASSDYKFKGWYRNGKRVSTKKTLTFYKSTSFTYTAKFVKKPYIVVSIAKQKLWFYEGGKLKYTTKVVTGDSKHHNTPKGTYYIKKKRRNLYLIGPDYRSWVNYWMPLYPNNHIGLHDATWRTSFGGTIYKRNGSHGCINLPYNAAKKIYAYTPLNTKVIIK